MTEIAKQDTIDLLPQIPEDRIVVTESGIHHHDDVTLMRENDVNAFLVGEHFMRQDDITQAVKDLKYGV